MKRKITTIDDELYLVDFENQTFLKVERLKSYRDYLSSKHNWNYDKMIEVLEVFDENKLNLNSTQQLILFCCCDGKWGAVNQNKEEIIPCIYDSLQFREDEFLYATLSDVHSVLDNKGIPYAHSGYFEINKEVNFFDYQAIDRFEGSLAIGIKDGYQGIVWMDGSVFLEPEYDDIKMKGGHIVVKKREQTISILYFENLKRWKKIPESYSFLKRDNTQKHFLVKKEDKIGVVDFSGEMLIPPIYTDLFFDYPDKDFVIATNSQGKKGILKRSDYQTILLDFEYDSIQRNYKNYPYSENLIIVKNDLQGICTQKGEILIEPMFKKDIELYPDTYDGDLIGFKKTYKENFAFKNKDGFINLNGEIVLLFDYDKIRRGFNTKDGRAVISTTYSQKFINKQGEILEQNDFERNWDDDTDYAADTWDALTDGQYGDYPDNGCDSDSILDFIGRG